MTKNQKWQKKIRSFLYPWAFFCQVWHVPHYISTSNIYFGGNMLIPVILSYIAAGYDHFRPFYQNLKNDDFFKTFFIFFNFYWWNPHFLKFFFWKNDHFSNFDKMAENDRIRLLYSSKWQELANCPRNKC